MVAIIINILLTHYINLSLFYKEKDQTLAALSCAAEIKQKNRLVQNVRKGLIEDRDNLKIAIYGDVQRVKNILQNHKDLQRLYQTMPAHMMIDNIDQRTFVKRKELDRLNDRKDKLTKTYEKKLVTIRLL